jgi:hypothetical protein
MLLLYVLKKICHQLPEDDVIIALKHVEAMSKDCTYTLQNTAFVGVTCVNYFIIMHRISDAKVFPSM